MVSDLTLPVVSPTLEITTAYNDENTEITHFNGKSTWQRPASFGMTDLENASVWIKSYTFELVDDKGNVVYTDEVPEAKDAEGNPVIDYEFDYVTDKNIENVDNCDLDFKTYTARIAVNYEFKNGDVIVKNNFIAIISHIDPDNRIWYHCWYNTKYEDCKIKTDFGIGRINDGDEIHFATKEEKEKLFKVIEDNGYNWNEKTNTLEKLIKPIFKKGDKVRVKNGVSEPRVIDEVCDRFYTLIPIGSIHFIDQHNWELVPNKFNINTLRPFESRVLVRDYSYEPWRVSFWGCLLDNELGFKYDTIRGPYKQCIPYEGNEHLLGRMEDCADFYKNW
jgi:hypothetical protein